MRVITEESIKAFYNKRKFKKRNMQVEVSYNSAKLNEYSCVNNICKETVYTCPSGQCVNGA
jgi:hypothetical protein